MSGLSLLLNVIQSSTCSICGTPTTSLHTLYKCKQCVRTYESCDAARKHHKRIHQRTTQTLKKGDVFSYSFQTMVCSYCIRRRDRVVAFEHKQA